jgi:hypothetical protein
MHHRISGRHSLSIPAILIIMVISIGLLLLVELVAGP